MKKVILRDKVTHQNYCLKLTEEQYRLLLWLDKVELLSDAEIEEFNGYEFDTI